MNKFWFVLLFLFICSCASLTDDFKTDPSFEPAYEFGSYVRVKPINQVGRIQDWGPIRSMGGDPQYKYFIRFHDGTDGFFAENDIELWKGTVEYLIGIEGDYNF